jgi:hypothetical protein
MELDMKDQNRYMVTHSLLSSWLYTLKDNPRSDRDHMAEFMKTLRREPIDTTEAMQKGRDFEALVTDILEGRDYPSSNWECAGRAVATAIRGAKLQVRASKTVEVDGMQVFLYGRLDALKQGIIYDIKYTSNYDAGKYRESTQHPMYFALVPGAVAFEYLISNGTNVWPERYTRDETPDIIPTIRDFFEWLRTQGLMDTYKEHWKAEER